MEVMIVILGGLYFFVRIVGGEIYGYHVESKKLRCKQEHEVLRRSVVNFKVEQEVEEFINRALDNSKLLSEVIGDNLKAIYGNDYWYQFKRLYADSRFNSHRTDDLIKWLIMSKKGYAPAYYYDNEWSLYFTQNSLSQTAFELRYFSQIQKNYDEVGSKLRLICCRDPHCNYERTVKFKHQFVHPSMAKWDIK